MEFRTHEIHGGTAVRPQPDARDRRCRRIRFLAWALNGEPLTKHQGAPLRLIVPGWYGVANVKWLSQIHVQDEQYLGRFQARWYRTLRGETIDGEMKWKETAITHMRLKSVHRAGDSRRRSTQGARLCAERRHADQVGRGQGGRWAVAAGDARSVTAKDKYSWKLFTYTWTGATPGQHTLVSRATDVNGQVQPTAAEWRTRRRSSRTTRSSHERSRSKNGSGFRA